MFDFSGVSNIDTTSAVTFTLFRRLRLKLFASLGIQNLVDLRRSLERYADRAVPFHFATILSPWIKRCDPTFQP